jgi:hypothetical protein
MLSPVSVTKGKFLVSYISRQQIKPVLDLMSYPGTSQIPLEGRVLPLDKHWLTAYVHFLVGGGVD